MGTGRLELQLGWGRIMAQAHLGGSKGDATARLRAVEPAAAAAIPAIGPIDSVFFGLQEAGAHCHVMEGVG
jgi:hypothetical protein